MPAIHVWFRCLAQAVYAKGLRALAGMVPLGEAVYDIAAETLERVRRSTAEAQIAAVCEVARASLAEVKDLAEQVALEVAADQPPAVQHQLAAWLVAVPATMRRTLRRPSDPTGTTAPAGCRIDSPEALVPFLPDRLPRFRPGERPTPCGAWELVEMLGSGGFGEVWLARHPQLAGLTAALKFCLDPAAARFLRHEAELLNRVMQQSTHPGIVPLRQAYLDAEPLCLVYEYVPGGDLAGLVRDWPAPPGGPSVDDRSRVAHHLATIVGHAHRLSPPIVHRDLKPANVLVQRRADRKLGLRIADFGIGAVAARQAIDRSRPGMRRGDLLVSALHGSHTPLYASPQQAQGLLPDARDDVHAIGVIWYQLLTGDLAAGRPSGKGWKRRLGEQGARAELLDLLEACLDDEPEERPRDAHELAVQLGEFLARPTLTALPASPPRPPDVSRRPRLVVAASGGGDYTDLLTALRAAPVNACIILRPGLYRGALRCERPVEIVGEGRRASIVLESDTGPVIHVAAEQVILRGVTIRGRAGSCQRSAYGVEVVRGHLILEDCDVSSDSLAGVAVSGATARVSLRRCQVHDSAAGGLFFWNQAGGLVEECEIRGNALPGIEVKEGADPVVRNCKIHHGGSAGILVSAGGRGTYEECDIHSHIYQGVAVHQDGAPVVRNCRIHDNKMGGIFLWGRGRGTFDGCDISGNALTGIEIKEESDAVFRNCTVRDGKAGGVLVSLGARGTFEDCDIYGNYRVGVEVRDNSEPVFRRCNVHGGQAGGLLFTLGARGVVERCDVWGNQLAGVSISEGANPTVRHCTIHDGQAGGLFIYEEGKGTVEGCEVFGNAMAAIEVKQRADPLVRNCRLHHGKAGGLFVWQDGRGTFERCEIDANALTGLEIKEGADPLVRACRFHGNVYQAVYVHDDGKGTIEGCDLSGNEAGAWYIDVGCSPRRRDNKE